MSELTELRLEVAKLKNAAEINKLRTKIWQMNNSKRINECNRNWRKKHPEKYSEQYKRSNEKRKVKKNE